MKQRTALFVPSFNHTAEHMLRVADALARRGHGCVFALTWPDHEPARAQCEERGISYVVALDPNGAGPVSATAIGTSDPRVGDRDSTLTSRQRLAMAFRRLRRRKRSRPVRELLDVIGVPARLMRTGGIALRTRRIAKQLMDDVRPDVVVYSESRTMVLSAYVVKEAAERSIPSILAPREITQTADVLASSRVRSRRTLERATRCQRVLQLLGKPFIGTNVRSSSGSHALFVPPERAWIAKLFGVWPEDPWTRGRDAGTVFAVQSEAQQEIAIAEGTSAGKIRVVGFPDYDDLSSWVRLDDRGRRSIRKEVCSQLGIAESKLLILYAGASTAQFTNLAAITDLAQYRKDVDHVIETALEVDANAHVIYKAHPRDSSTDFPIVERDASRLTVVQDFDFNRLLGASDAFVAAISSTIDRALALGKPTLTFDFYDSIEYENVMARVPSHVSVRRREDLQDSFGKLMRWVEGAEPEWAAPEGSVSSHVVVDGRSTERMADLVERMGEGVNGDQPVEAAA